MAKTKKSEKDALVEQLKLQNSFKHRFKLGVVQGIGSAIGTTIVASFVLVLLARMIATAERVPLLDSLLDRLVIDNVIQQRAY